MHLTLVLSDDDYLPIPAIYQDILVRDWQSHCFTIEAYLSHADISSGSFEIPIEKQNAVSTQAGTQAHACLSGRVNRRLYARW